MPRKKNNKKRKEEICEDCCFDCKDGGLLLVCDYKDCLKVYHTQCAGKDDTFVETGGRLTCKWHSCFICKKTAKFHCFCCPRAVCGRCLYDAQFAVVKRIKGFCNQCLKLAFLIEENLDADSDGGRVDFNEQNTYEYLFKEYWVIIKEKEGLSAEHVHSAKKALKMDKNYRFDFESNEIFKSEENLSETDEEMVSDYEGKGREGYVPAGKKKRSKGKLCPVKRKVKAKKRDFIGWGSTSLVEFLSSIGKDTTKDLSQYEVTTIVTNYCKENKLFDPEKKNKVICDAMLRSIFGRKSVSKNSVNKLLSSHFAENLESTEEDETGSNSEDRDDNCVVTSKRQAKLSSTVVQDVRRTCFSSIISENIKLVYLKRSLVEELLKQPETFAEKVVGSFVRVKSDPYDYTQKNDHQLLQVQGIKKSSRNGDVNAEIFLQFSNVPLDLPVCRLSDDDFCEEECEDLQRRMKDGLLKKPTIVEVEQKARSLHEDITKHWIARELALLQKRIDRANEKGWRREFHYTLWECMDKKQLLESPSEQSRLLNEVPEVIADIEKFGPTPENPAIQDKQGHDCSPESVLRGSSHTPSTDLANGTSYFPSGKTDPAGVPEGISKREEFLQVKKMSFKPLSTEAFEPEDVQQEMLKSQSISKAEVIELSDDDDNDVQVEVTPPPAENLGSTLWYCMSPHGEERGPFKMSLLKEWNKSHDLKFKVWREGQSKKEAIFLNDAIRQSFPNL